MKNLNTRNLSLTLNQIKLLSAALKHAEPATIARANPELIDADFGTFSKSIAEEMQELAACIANTLLMEGDDQNLTSMMYL